MNFKNAIIVILLLIIVGGGAFYFGQNSSNFTSSPTNNPTTTQASSTPIPATSEAISPTHTTTTSGKVSGKLCYPSSFLPKGTIEAKNINNQELHSEDYPGSENGGGSMYTFELPEGEYHFRYKVSSELIGYHTTVCSTGTETTCADTKKRVIASAKVKSDQTTTQHDLCDFYHTPVNAPEF